MTRSEIEKIVEPMIRERLRKFGDYTPSGISAEEFARAMAGELRLEVRRVSLLVSLAQTVAGDKFDGEGLELGCGYGYLLFPMALFNPQLRWTTVEHPNRRYFSRSEFQQAMRDYKCQLIGADFVQEPLPFPDQRFSVITFRKRLNTCRLRG